MSCAVAWPIAKAGRRSPKRRRCSGSRNRQVRAWIDSGLLQPIAGTRPVRVEVLSLADVKGPLDLIRRHKDDRQLLVQVMHILRDRAVLAGDDVRTGFDDLVAGRTVPLGNDLLAEIAAIPERGRRQS